MRHAPDPQQHHPGEPERPSTDAGAPSSIFDDARPAPAASSNGQASQKMKGRAPLRTSGQPRESPRLQAPAADSKPAVAFAGSSVDETGNSAGETRAGQQRSGEGAANERCGTAYGPLLTARAGWKTIEAFHVLLQTVAAPCQIARIHLESPRLQAARSVRGRRSRMRCTWSSSARRLAATSTR